VGDLASIFKAYDIRPVVPDQLNEDVAEAVGAAFALAARSIIRNRSNPGGTCPRRQRRGSVSPTNPDGPGHREGDFHED
jgi:hypothetical protein